MTTYDYYLGIPATGNDPSIDQPNMAVNTNSINSIIGTNHLSFGTATGPWVDGMHTIVQLVNQTDPSTIGQVGQLYQKFIANAGSTLPQLWYKAGNQATYPLTCNFLPVINSADGYVDDGATFLPGGIIVNFGTGTLATGGVPVTFDKAFTNIPMLILSAPSASPTYNTLTISGFNVGNSTSPGQTFNWIAIGN